MRVYIINGHVTRKKIDDISRHIHFMGYATTTGTILYWKPDHIFFIHIAHHVWFDEYNHHLYIYDKHTSGSLLIQQHPESLIHNLELINLILCKLDLNPLHSLIQQFSHMKLSYPLLDRKLVLIYLAMNILQSLMSLIKFKTHQSVINFQHRLNQICGSLI